MKLPEVNVTEIAKETFRDFFGNNMDKFAAAVAFQMLFAIIPFIIVLITILGFLDLRMLYDIMYEHALHVVPAETTELVEQFVREIEQPAGGLLPLALLLALWVASSAIRSVTGALNIIYKVEETRPFWWQFLMSIIYTLAITCILILAMLFMMLGPRALEWIAGLVYLDEAFITLWAWLRWPVAMFLLMLAIGFIYFAAPDVKQKFRTIIPGSVLSVLVWIGMSLGLDFYMRNVADLSILFGGLGAIIYLMIYFYISAAVLLFGAGLNVVIERRRNGG